MCQAWPGWDVSKDEVEDSVPADDRHTMLRDGELEYAVVQLASGSCSGQYHRNSGLDTSVQ